MRERELALQERRIEHEIKTGGNRQGWASPLVVAVLAAAVAAGGSVVVTYVEGEQTRELEFEQAQQTRVLEAQRAENARIQQMLETGDPDAAAENLRSLVEVGLVSDGNMRTRLDALLDDRSPKEEPALATKQPAQSQAPMVPDQFTPFAEMPYPIMTIQSALVASEVCGDDQLIQDGVFGTRAQFYLSQFLEILPLRMVKIADYAPDVIRQWAAEGLPEDWGIKPRFCGQSMKRKTYHA